MKYDWKNCTIGDLCSSVSETYKRKSAKVVLINTSDVLEGTILNHDYVDNIKLKGQFKKTFQKNDILFSEIRPANKRYAFVDFDNTLDYIASTKLMVLRPNTEKVIPSYLYFILKSKNMLSELQYLAETRSGTFPQITFDSELSQMPVMLPDIETQKKIIDILKTIEDKIAANNAINKNLMEQAQAIYNKIFVDACLVTSSWEEHTLNELTSLITRGIAPKYDEEAQQLVINQKCIRNHTVDLSIARKHKPKKINKKWVKYGDVLINSTGTGTLGRVAPVWFSSENVTVDSHVTIVRPLNRKLLYYIDFWGINHEREIEALHTGTTGQTELPREYVKEMKILLPDDDSLKKFNEKVEPITMLIHSNQMEMENLSTLRDNLLPRLLSGEIDVSSIEI